MSETAPGTVDRPLRVAVIGSGPSGFYAIQALFKRKDLEVRADLFDRLPTPYGLVRGGVAPDHQKIKNVIRVYDKVATDERCRFFGNVLLGEDMTLEELTARYDAVVLATGNESDRKLGIPGEELDGVYSATEFVGWYNGHPDFQDRDFDLARARSVVVIGNGNVAMDVTRVLAKTPGDLAGTDITSAAIDRLEESRVTDVILLGRRGPAQAAFSPKEIKEVGEIPTCHLAIRRSDVELGSISQAWLDEHGDRDAHKNMGYLIQVADHVAGEDNKRTVSCRFLASPVEFLGDNGRLTGVVVEQNELYLDARGTPRPRGTGERYTLDAQMVFKAIGYRGIPIPGVPFHEAWGIIPNEGGRVTDSPSGDTVPGLYAVGWAKRGPTGLIGTNSKDSQATVAKLLEDLEGGLLGGANIGQDIADLFGARGVDFVSWKDWQRLNEDEIARGQARGKIREKYTDTQDMMDAIRRLREG